MNYTSLAGELQSLVRGSIRINESMRKHTTWKIGGNADVFLDPSDKGDIRQAVEFARERAVPFTVIGNGSNLLIKDGGIRGLVIKIGRGMANLSVNGNRIRAGAGAMLPELAAVARKNGLGGFEFAAGIPGSLGGAVVMNAGAINGCAADVLVEVEVVNHNNKLVVLKKEELDFAYRTSSLQNQGLICVETLWQGYAKEQWQIERETKEYLAKRKIAQPQGYPNAGSVFKNPQGDHAGRLIEACGCKGLRIGDAEISTKHANWILNLGNATAKDVLDLIDKIKQVVQKRFGVLLHLEVRVLGED
ncbi:UDP-N-acetylmuramate dehydrogenase [Desulfotomaculum sp. 1211_IL3151]|uniref:UDP-N-acetylmuramate dehydrogenase n=1 Tax=Desulfotomaculum sp. 1211_IL3151 TaxID=3084055 RepID=UPI002FD93ECA